MTIQNKPVASCVLVFPPPPSTKQNSTCFVRCDGAIKRGFCCQLLTGVLRQPPFLLCIYYALMDKPADWSRSNGSKQKWLDWLRLIDSTRKWWWTKKNRDAGVLNSSALPTHLSSPDTMQSSLAERHVWHLSEGESCLPWRKRSG